jgi:hypothetical protein
MNLGLTPDHENGRTSTLSELLGYGYFQERGGLKWPPAVALATRSEGPRAQPEDESIRPASEGTHKVAIG